MQAMEADAQRHQHIGYAGQFGWASMIEARCQLPLYDVEKAEVQHC